MLDGLMETNTSAGAAPLPSFTSDQGEFAPGFRLGSAPSAASAAASLPSFTSDQGELAPGFVPGKALDAASSVGATPAVPTSIASAAAPDALGAALQHAAIPFSDRSLLAQTPSPQLSLGAAPAVRAEDPTAQANAALARESAGTNDLTLAQPAPQKIGELVQQITQPKVARPVAAAPMSVAAPPTPRETASQMPVQLPVGEEDTDAMRTGYGAGLEGLLSKLPQLMPNRPAPSVPLTPDEKSRLDSMYADVKAGRRDMRSLTPEERHLMYRESNQPSDSITGTVLQAIYDKLAPMTRVDQIALLMALPETKLLSLAFAVSQGKGAILESMAAYQAAKSGDSHAAVVQATGAVLDTLMAGLAAAHGAKGLKNEVAHARGEMNQTPGAESKAQSSAMPDGAVLVPAAAASEGAPAEAKPRVESKTGREILQPSNDPKMLAKMAKDSAPALRQGLNLAVAGVDGAQVHAVREVKNPDRVQEKIKEENQPASTHPDFLAAQISVDSLPAAAAAAEAVKRQFPLVREENELDGKSETGYPVHKLQVRMPNGISAEVHVVPREVLEGGTAQHREYKRAREADITGSDRDYDAAVGEAKAKNAAAMAKFTARNKAEQDGRASVAVAPSNEMPVMGNNKPQAATPNPLNTQADAVPSAPAAGVASEPNPPKPEPEPEPAEARVPSAVPSNPSTAGGAPPAAKAERFKKRSFVLLPDGSIAQVIYFNESANDGQGRARLMTVPKEGAVGRPLASVSPEDMTPLAPVKVERRKTGSAAEAAQIALVERDGPEMLARYMAANTTDGRLYTGTDQAKGMFPAYVADPLHMNEDTDAAASALSQAAWRTALARPPAAGREVVVLTTGTPASGKTVGILSGDPVGAVGIEREAIMNDFGFAKTLIDEAAASGRRPEVRLIFTNDPRENVRRMVKRAKEIGRTVPISFMAKTFVNAPRVAAEIHERYREFVRVTVVDNSGKPGEAKEYTENVEPALAVSHRWTEQTAKEAMHEELERLHQAGYVPEGIYAVASGEAVRGEASGQQPVRSEALHPRGADSVSSSLAAVHGEPEPRRAGGQELQLGRDVAAEPSPRVPKAAAEAETETGSSAPPPLPQTHAEPGTSKAPGWFGRMLVTDLHVDAKRFQYKLNTDAGGATGKLKDAQWNERLGGLLHVWRDPENGLVYVINGHHRFDLARRSGAREVKVEFYPEDVRTDSDARVAGAIDNIADNKGTAVDAAKFFRDTGRSIEYLRAMGLSVSGAVADGGEALRKLDPWIFDQVVSGRIDEKQGIAIGKLGKTPALQEELLREIRAAEAKGKPVTNATLEEMARQQARAGEYTTESMGLFGLEQRTFGMALHIAELSSYVRSRILAEKRLFGGLTNATKAETLKSAENTINTVKNKTVAERASQAAELYDILSARTGRVYDILAKGARDLADGQKDSEVKKRTYDDIRAALAEIIRRAVPEDSAGSGAGAEPAADRTGRAQEDQLAPPDAAREPKPTTTRPQAARGAGKPTAKTLDITGGGPLFQREKTEAAPSWYLKSARLIDAKMKGPMSGIDLQRMLENNGVTRDELKWTGLEDFLRGKFRVTPAEAKQAIADGGVRVEEVQKGDLHKDEIPAGWRVEIRRDGDGYDVLDEQGEMIADGPDRQSAITNARRRDRSARFMGETRYSDPDWQLPGGANYRELLLKLPETPLQVSPLGRIEHLLNGMFRVDAPSLQPMVFKTLAEAEAETRKLGEIFNRKKAIASDYQNYRGTHWDEPNVLAHVRFNDRMTPDGVRLLHLEELQSDWHQQGRDFGYDGGYDADFDKFWLPVQKRLVQDLEGFEDIIDANNEQFNYPELGGESLLETGLAYRLLDAIRRGENFSESGVSYNPKTFVIENSSGLSSQLVPRNELIVAQWKIQRYTKSTVPDAPFKKNWHEMVFRRMVRYAAEGGYDGVSWTPGEEQNKRYDLSKQVEAIRANKNANGTYQLNIQPIGENMQRYHTDLPADRLADHVGKDLAGKIVSEVIHPGVDHGKVFSSLDLKVGGEGMKGFYDKILPDYARKFGKRWGAKVETATIHGGKTAYKAIPSEQVPGEFQVGDQAGNPPDYARKFGKRWGAKVETATIHGGKTAYKAIPSEQVPGEFQVGDQAGNPRDTVIYMQEADAARAAEIYNKREGLSGVTDAGLAVPVLNITPEMRRSVLSEGVSLFQREDGSAQAMRTVEQLALHTRFDVIPSDVEMGHAPMVDLSRSARDLLNTLDGELADGGGAWNGVTLPKGFVDQTVQMLHLTAADLRSKGRDPQAQQLRDFAQTLDGARDAGGNAILLHGDFADNAIGEEQFHAAQLRTGGTLGDVVLQMGQTPEVVKARAYLAKRGYADGAATAVVEAAAKVANGDWLSAGLTLDEGARLIRQYFDALVKARGAAALDEMPVIADEIQHILNDAREKYDRTDGRQAEIYDEEPGGGVAGAEPRAKKQKTWAEYAAARRRVSEGDDAGRAGSEPEGVTGQGRLFQRRGAAAEKSAAAGEVEQEKERSKSAPLDVLIGNLAKHPSVQVGIAERIGKSVKWSAASLKDSATDAAKAMAGLKGAVAAMWDRYRHPAAWTDIQRLTGDLGFEESYAAQKLDAFTKHMRRVIPDKARREALTNWVEADGDKSVLEHRAYNTKDAKLRKGYEIALTLTPEEKAVGSEMRSYMRGMYEEGKRSGLLSHAFSLYMTHLYEGDDAGLRSLLDFGELAPNPWILKPREFRTYFDAEQSGYIPKDKDAGYLLGRYHDAFSKALASRSFIRGLLSGKDKDGRPLGVLDSKGKVVQVSLGEEPYTISSPPSKEARDKAFAQAFEEEGEAWKSDPANKGKESPTPVELRGMAERASVRASAGFGPSRPDNIADYRVIDHHALRNWKWELSDAQAEEINPKLFEDAEKALVVQGDILVHPEVYKHVKNLLSTSAIAAHPVGSAVLKLSSEGKQVMLSFSGFHQFQEGIHASEHKVVPVWKHSGSWKIMPKDMPVMNLDDATQADLVRHGLVLSGWGAEEAMSEGVSGSALISHVPLVGDAMAAYQHYLFHDYIPRLKMAMAVHALKRNRLRYAAKLDRDQILRLTAEQANAAFGGLNYKMMGRNPTFQDILRLLFLAPDFLEARARFYLQGLKPYGQEQRSALIRGALVMYVTARLFNSAVNDGDAKWDPADAFSYVYHERRYNLRTVQGDVLHLATDPRNFTYNRLNPLTTRALVEFLTGRDQFGRQKELTSQMEDYLKGVLPIPVQGRMQNPDQNWAGSLLTSLGMQASTYRSPAGELAHKLYLRHIPDTPEGKQDEAETHMMVKLERDLRAGTKTTTDVWQAVKDGKITPHQAGRIQRDAAVSPLAKDFNILGVEDALAVYNKASAAERLELRPLLAKKVDRDLNETLAKKTESEQAQLKAELTTAFKGSDE